MHLFIDANIFLGFYEATSDSLLELEKLISVLKRKKRATLWLLDQVKRDWIHDDSDVKKFISDFLAKYGAVIDAVTRSELKKLVA